MRSATPVVQVLIVRVRLNNGPEVPLGTSLQRLGAQTLLTLIVVGVGLLKLGLLVGFNLNVTCSEWGIATTASERRVKLGKAVKKSKNVPNWEAFLHAEVIH